MKLSLLLMGEDLKNKHASGPEELRTRHRGSKYHSYPDSVLQELNKIDAFSEKNCHSITHMAQQQSHKIAAVCIVELRQGVSSVMDYLSPALRIQFNFWAEEYSQQRQLFHLKILDIVSLESPTRITTTGGTGALLGSMFFRLSKASSRRLMASKVATGPALVRCVIEHWAAENLLHPDLDEVQEQALGLRLPMSWVWLLQNHIWQSISVPMLKKSERRRSGYAQVPFDAFGREPGVFGDGDKFQLDMSLSQNAADTMRTLVPSSGGDVADEARLHITWLQQHADMMDKDHWRQVGQMFDMNNMVDHCLFSGLLSGLGSDAQHVRTCLGFALRAILPKDVAEHFHKRIRDFPELIPHKSSLHRHQFTLTMGWQVYLQQLHTAILKCSSGFVRWESSDSFRSAATTCI